MPMMKFVKLIKPWASVLVLIAALKFTGLFSYASYYSQAMLIESGLLNAPTERKGIEPFLFDFELQTLDGKVLPTRDLKGKVIFLNLWATWCGPCRAEMPSIQKLYSAAASDSIVFIMLSIDKRGDEPKIEKYLQEKRLTLPVYRPIESLPEKLKVPSIPTTFVIDKKGNIVYEKVGVANYDTNRFKDFLNSLSNE